MGPGGTLWSLSVAVDRKWPVGDKDKILRAAHFLSLPKENASPKANGEVDRKRPAGDKSANYI